MTQVRQLHRQGPLTFRVNADASPRPPASPTFVLLHGIGMSHRSLSRLHDALAEAGAVYSIDMPGCGGLPKPRMDVDVPHMAQGLAEVIASLDVGHVVLIGHSMGAQWATAVARQNPELVDRLVLIGPVVDSRHRTLLAQMAALARDTLGESPRINAIAATDYLRCGIRWYRAQARHMFGYALDEEVARLTVPVLILRGGRDPIAGPEWCRRLRDRAPSSSLVTIPRHRHVVPYSAPHAVASAIHGADSGQERENGPAT